MTEKRPVDSSSDAKLAHEIEGLLAVDPSPELFARLRSRLAEEPRSPGAGPLVTGYRWFKFLLKGSIRVPVPVGLAVAVVLVLMVVALVRRQTVTPGVPSISLVDFGPVNDVNVRVIRGYESN
jgi:hypothetical protein